MNYKSIIESILYIYGKDGVKISNIKKAVNLPSDEIRQIIKEMNNDYINNPNCGLLIKQFDDHFTILTKPENNDFISILSNQTIKNPLPQSALEALAIIAYNAPCKKSKIEEIRGTDATSSIARLIELNLIKKIGEAETVGNPYLYDVTDKFFNLFGIKSLNELPKINFDSIDEIINDNENFFDSNRNNENE